MNTLQQHLIDMHPAVHLRRSRANADLVRVHRYEHHHFATNHYHDGPNIGAGDRPAGWTTGEGAVPRPKREPSWVDGLVARSRKAQADELARIGRGQS